MNVNWCLDFDIFRGFTSFGAQTHSLLLHQHQFKPFELYETNGVSSLIRGLLMQPAQKMDRAFTDEVNLNVSWLFWITKMDLAFFRLRTDFSKVQMNEDSI